MASGLVPNTINTFFKGIPLTDLPIHGSELACVWVHSKKKYGIHTLITSVSGNITSLV